MMLEYKSILQNQIILIIVILALALLLGFITTTGIKSQWIRLVDIFIIGPLMIYLALYGIGNKSQQSDPVQDKEPTQWLYYLLMFFGATTITYNLRNYFYSSGWM